MSAPYEILTEAAGVPIADEAASMLVTRYLTASDLAAGRRTLELACASGVGLRLLSRSASLTVGGDINATMLARAQRHYQGTVPLVRLAANTLPFSDGAFEFVLLMEASYYIENFERALAEIDRVLAGNGRLLLVSANPERSGFIRSPLSHHYHSADQFRTLLESLDLRVEVYGAFRCDDNDGRSGSLRTRMLGHARRALGQLGLVPRTLEGRARLKRLVGQKLRRVPGEIGDGFAPRAELIPLSPGPAPGFKVIYVVADRTRQ